MSFKIYNKLTFIDSFQFLSYSLDSLFKNLNKNDLNYLCQELNKNALDLVKQKEFYSYEYISDSKRCKKNYLTHKSFIVL